MACTTERKSMKTFADGDAVPEETLGGAGREQDYARKRMRYRK